MDKLYRVVRRYGITRLQVLDWLQLQPGYTLHKPAGKKFRRNRVFVNGQDQQWQTDLADLIEQLKSMESQIQILIDLY